MKEKIAHLVIDLGFGDSGKGSVVDAIARHSDVRTVVRFNGGLQAAHNVVTDCGVHHTFSQFGSATFVPNVRTHLSRFTIVSPWAMIYEACALAKLVIGDVWNRLSIDDEALVVTPFQRAANRLREVARGNNKHGSCGVGVGEAVSDSLELCDDLVVRIGDFRNPDLLKRKFERAREHKADQVKELIEYARSLPGEICKDEIWDLESDDSIPVWFKMLDPFFNRANIVERTFLGDLLREDGDVIFEGAQGVLLDEWRGFHPYTTWSTCTDQSARVLLSENRYDGDIRTYGLVRAYATRHGNGPFPTYDPELTAYIPELHNKTDQWQGGFRVGWFDAVLSRYTIACCERIDSLVITCIDRLCDAPEWKICVGYRTPDGTEIADMALGRFQDLAYQERLGVRLNDMRPNYKTTTISDRTFEEQMRLHVAAISDELTRPVSILSTGPAAKDKRFL